MLWKGVAGVVNVRNPFKS